MTRRNSREEFASAFGQALDRQLAKKGLGQSDLANATGTSASYINRLMRGRKVSPEWADKVSDVLDLTPKDRRSLHVAAAVTWGFKLDLTRKTNGNSSDE
jgi:transcriptional regulator with XRE-family HTH domain